MAILTETLSKLDLISRVPLLHLPDSEALRSALGGDVQMMLDEQMMLEQQYDWVGGAHGSEEPPSGAVDFEALDDECAPLPARGWRSHRLKRSEALAAVRNGATPYSAVDVTRPAAPRSQAAPLDASSVSDAARSSGHRDAAACLQAEVSDARRRERLHVAFPLDAE